MVLTQAFWFLFIVLDACWDRCRENDLGGLLGGLSPYLWANRLPMDIANVEDWEALCRAREFCRKNAVDCILLFLESYEKQYGFSFLQTKKLLQTLTEREVAGFWQTACRQAEARGNGEDGIL